MKGFGIEIKNTLLEPKHIESMGPAIWLYLFLLDKITSIDETGVGKVLGGKPIKFQEVHDEIGISQDTYTRWIDRLVSYPYIQAIRTPNGISFRVFKTHKRFKKGFRINAESLNDTSKKEVKSDSAKTRKGFRNIAESDSAIVRNANKDILSVDNNKDISSGRKNSSASGKEKKEKKEKSPHKKFIEFWDAIVLKTRHIKPIYTGADMRNLKRILDFGIEEQTLEQIALFFLADNSFRAFSPSISTLCSSGIINGLLNRSKYGNDPEFGKKLFGYMDIYIPREGMPVQEKERAGSVVSMAEAMKKILDKYNQNTLEKIPA